jgi:hypothetical protein
VAALVAALVPAPGAGTRPGGDPDGHAVPVSCAPGLLSVGGAASTAFSALQAVVVGRRAGSAGRRGLPRPPGLRPSPAARREPDIPPVIEELFGIEEDPGCYHPHELPQ